MKQLLLLAVSLTLSSVMLAQNPCLEPGANPKGLQTYLQSLSGTDIVVGTTIEECFKISPDDDLPSSPNAPQATIAVLEVNTDESVGALLTIYAEGATTPFASEPIELTGPLPSININTTLGTPFGVEATFSSIGSITVSYKRRTATAKEFTFNVVAASVAPVTWTTPLAAQPFGENLQLSFSVADQVDVAGYELERAVGTQPFAKVADIEYVENGSLEVDYSVSTPWVRAGSYYRIKQLDFAGTYDYSNVIFVEGNDGAKQRFQMFPNPASDFVRMSLPAEVTSVDLISASGQLLRSAPASDVNRDGLDVRGVSPGLYLVRPVGGDQPSQPQRLVVNH